LGGVVGGFFGGPGSDEAQKKAQGQQFAARLAHDQPGLSAGEFMRAMSAAGYGADDPRGGGIGFLSGGAFYGIYQQLSGGGPKTVSAPGRFQAERPGDLLGASDLRFKP
jgi:hypothetical protein